MPEMTPERIDALAQSAQDRDPNPEPLSDFAEPGTVRLTVFGPWLGAESGSSTHEYTAPEDVIVEVAQTGALEAHGSGFALAFAPGAWTRYEAIRADEAEDAR